MPVLHRVGDIRCLNLVLNHNGSLAVHRVTSWFRSIRSFLESLASATVAESLEVLVHNVGRHDRVDNKLAKATHLLIRGAQGAAEIIELFVHEQVPGQVHRILLGHALAMIRGGDIDVLLDKLSIRYTRMIHVVNERCKHAGKLRQGIRRDTAGVVVEKPLPRSSQFF